MKECKIKAFYIRGYRDKLTKPNEKEEQTQKKGHKNIRSALGRMIIVKHKKSSNQVEWLYVGSC